MKPALTNLESLESKCLNFFEIVINKNVTFATSLEKLAKNIPIAFLAFKEIFPS